MNSKGLPRSLCRALSRHGDLFFFGEAMQPFLIGAQEELILDATETHDAIVSEQILGDDFWDDLAQAKEDFQFRLNGLTPVASIPEALANKWLREGFDLWEAPAQEIIRKLKLEGYDRFVISGDKTF
jgi:hypothetical protein